MKPMTNRTALYDRCTRFGFSLAILMQFALPAAAQKKPMTPGQASGWFSIDGQKLNLQHVYALAQPNAFDEKQMDLAILLSEKPLAAQAIKDATDLLKVATTLKGWVFFKLNSKNEPIYEAIDHVTLKGQRLMNSGTTTAKFTLKSVDSAKVSGAFRTAKAETIFDHRYQIDADFVATIVKAKLPEPLPNAKTGKRLPKDGGEPGKTYRIYLKALVQKDVKTLKAVSPLGEKAQDLSPEELEKGLDFMASLAPKNVKIHEGFIQGERAVIYVSGVENKEKQYGTVELIRKEGTWRIVQDSWSNEPPKK